MTTPHQNSSSSTTSPRPVHPRGRADPRHDVRDGGRLPARLRCVAHQSDCRYRPRRFGPDDYRERLDVYLAALHDIDGMHAPGIVNFFGQLSQWLKNRLLLTDLVSRHPEIHDIELLPPVVIAGLPRTGTTHLHNLLFFFFGCRRR